MAQSRLTYSSIYSGDGYLVVEGIRLTGSGVAAPINATPPPLRDRILESDLDGSNNYVSRQYGWFFQSVYDGLVRALGTKGVSLVGVEAPSLDLTDLAWYATAGAVNATDDPVVILPTIFGASAYGRQFVVGEYVLFNDSTVVGALYSYEICKIIDINTTTGEWTLQRRQNYAAPGFAAFGTMLADHAAGVTINHLIDQYFFTMIPFGSEQVWRIVWESMTIPAIILSVETQPDILVNLIAPPPAAANPGIDTGLL